MGSQPPNRTDRRQQLRLALGRRLAGPAPLCALLIATLLVACSDPEPLPAQRLFEFTSGATYDADPGRSQRRMLVSAAELDRDAWRPLIRLETPATAEELGRFLAASTIEPDGTPVIGPARGSWLTSIPIEGGGPVFLRSRLRFDGPRRDAEPRVSVFLAELTREPTPGADTDLAESLVELHGTRAADGSRRSVDLALDIDLDPRTRALAILCSQERDGDHGPSARVEGLEVFRPSFIDVVANSTSEGRSHLQVGEPLAGLFRIGMVSRPGLALAPGDELELPLPVPTTGARLQAWLGLDSHPMVADGAQVEVTLSARPLNGPGRTPLGSWTLESASQARRRWLPIDVELPSRLGGRSAVLQVGVRSIEGHAAPALLMPTVLAAPRVVPDRLERRGPNVVLISVDTLRPDHLGAYGYDRPTSPSIDRLAERSLVFDDVWAQGPYTLPSHMSLMSGQHPSVHGALRDPGSVDPDRTRLLAERFADAGYATAAFVGGGYLLPSFGFAPGFDTYSVIDPCWNRESQRIRDFVDDTEELDFELANSVTMETVVDWVADHSQESFLLFVHTYAAHEFDPPRAHREAMGFDLGPLDAYPNALRWLAPSVDRPPVLGDEDRQVLTDLYDAAIHQADEAVGQLLDGLERLQLLDETIVVLTSDHGKEIGDHGGVGHGHTLYEELLQVPLLISGPGIDPGRSDRPVMLVDVLPTLTHMAGLAAPVGVQGVDLLAVEPAARTLWAEVEAATERYAARSGSRKTIWAPPNSTTPLRAPSEEQTFDLGIDPGEQHALPPDGRRVAAVRGYRDVLLQLAEALGGSGRSDGAMSESTREHLEALGYTVSDGPDTTGGSGRRVDSGSTEAGTVNGARGQAETGQAESEQPDRR
ncbi:sulfatase [Engelhardtia mirabilis]|uniref:Arylsulfatase n=1 Tax=Engelhardtia mirabilis TaxID=2528011 RepID=A0A518BFH0_9BACT|nr:Arylsulfatase [Planctomycetes bacterium Pla133]QDV00038.1 Arylsulfatase [Planctomycetes bacterium Pla86]